MYLPLPRFAKDALREYLLQKGILINQNVYHPGKYPPDQLYRRLFPAESITHKAFYNFGSGVWRHPLWTNIDYDSHYYAYKSDLIDINWDIASGAPVSVENNAAELVYSSHTVEHLLDAHVDHMLSEAFRILKPGGIIRVTTPNIQLNWEAYKRGDVWFTHHFGNALPLDEGQNRQGHEMSVMLVNEIGSQLVQSVNGHKPRFTSHQEIDALINDKPLEEALQQFTDMIDFNLQKVVPGHHVSWWTNEKMCAAMMRAGFSKTIVSVFGGSVCPAMRDLNYFDLKEPTCSLFVEGIK